MGDRWIKFVDEKKLHEALGKVKYISPSDGLFAVVRSREDGKLRKSMLPPAHSCKNEVQIAVEAFHKDMPERIRRELNQVGKSQTVEDRYKERKHEEFVSGGNIRGKEYFKRNRLIQSCWRETPKIARRLEIAKGKFLKRYDGSPKLAQLSDKTFELIARKRNPK